MLQEGIVETFIKSPDHPPDTAHVCGGAACLQRELDRLQAEIDRQADQLRRAIAQARQVLERKAGAR